MIPSPEMKKLLEKRAKRLLEQSGYSFKKLQGGGYQVAIVTPDLQEKPVAKFDDIIQLGIVFKLWAEDGPGDRDPVSGLDRPRTAAVRERVSKEAGA